MASVVLEHIEMKDAEKLSKSDEKDKISALRRQLEDKEK